MSKEAGGSSNVVATLMGLEALPHKSEQELVDLVRRSFMDLVVDDDDKHHKSKEFQKALQVLSSYKDSNSSSPRPQDKRITVLRPSKAVKETASSKWTQIVVLKPRSGKALDIKAIAPSCFNESGDSETKGIITSQMRETFWGRCRNETLSPSSSSVLSNGYICDDGSFNRSNNEYPVTNVGDSENVSPSSRHSWNCANRFESHFSSSSFRRASFSRESSVCREAKKRLSERWAMMSLNGDTQQQESFPTALGDMLTLSEKKVPTRSNEESNKVKQETRRSISCISSGLHQVENTSDSLKNLERSNSVPEIRHRGGTSVSGTLKAQATRELTESRSLKSSWKVSSLFFFRNKKANKKTNAPSQLTIASNALQQQSIFTSEGEVTIPSDNQDQPSPVSVLQQLFEEEQVGKPWITQGEGMSLKSNMIDKSPPIGSIARVCSWEDESYTDITRTGTGIKEDEDWYDFVTTVLRVSGFSSSGSLMTRWHSPDSPLDPSLRDQLANKEHIKRRKHRLDCKLIFDCVNAIITETASTAAHTGLTEGFDMAEHVWKELKNKAVHGSNNLEGESEAVGKMWSRNQQVETNSLGIEIGLVLLQELVEDAVFDLTR